MADPFFVAVALDEATGGQPGEATSDEQHLPTGASAPRPRRRLLLVCAALALVVVVAVLAVLLVQRAQDQAPDDGASRAAEVVAVDGQGAHRAEVLAALH